MSRRTFNPAIKSLLHFDYPYPNEQGNGLRDEIGTYTWSAQGSAKFAGSEGPAAEIIAGTPKFGYRCLHTQSSNDFITSSGDWALSASSNYEVCMWIRVSASQAGPIFSLYNGDGQTFAIILTADRIVMASCGGMSLTSTDPLPLNTWVCLKLQLSSSTCTAFMNDSLLGQVSVNRTDIPATSARVGGFNGFIDEFIFRTTLTTSYPSEPIQGVCSADSLGGFGTGKLGDVTIYSADQINTEALMTSASGLSLAYTKISVGRFGTFAVDDELMLLNLDTGEYTFRRVSAVAGKSVVLGEAANIPLPAGRVLLIQIPHFNTLTVNSGLDITTHNFDTMPGGVIAFRVRGNCTINGNLLTGAKGPKRSDNYPMTHAELVDRFLINDGGGVFITCGGTLTIPSTARIGGRYNGENKGGLPYTTAEKSEQYHGGAGYGGGGGYDYARSRTGTAGGVGIGGSCGTGEAGALPGQSSYHDGEGGHAGACVLLVPKTLNVDGAALATGGVGGFGGAGGGTGFCYIACERTA